MGAANKSNKIWYVLVFLITMVGSLGGGGSFGPPPPWNFEAMTSWKYLFEQTGGMYKQQSNRGVDVNIFTATSLT